MKKICRFVYTTQQAQLEPMRERDSIELVNVVQFCANGFLSLLTVEAIKKLNSQNRAE